MNTLLIDALKGQNHARPPVWLMRQAGRYMASYRALRQKYSFLEMCHQPELITQVTLLPIEAYGMDAAILFSDILVVAEAMGLGLRFDEGLGPVIERPISSVHDILALPDPDVSKLDFVRQGILHLKPALKVPLIGFCGAPFTIASYLIEGGTSRDHKKTKHWMMRDPQSFHVLLKKIADWSIAYLKMQIQAGVNALQIFDSWANVLAHRQFREFSLAYLDYILKGLKADIPVILFCRGSSVFAPQLAEIQPAGISLDWNCDIAAMRTQIPSTIALQGNLDPMVLYASHQTIRNEVNHILNGMAHDKAFIFNLGHGLLPDLSEDSVRVLVESVKEREVCLVKSSS